MEKGQPYFDKVSKNIYLQAIKDGFLAAMPIILSSSVFLLISTLPGVVATVGGFTLPDWWNVDVVNFCNKVYNFTMGVVGIMVAGTTASALTGSKNRRMPAGKAINATSTMVAAMCAMLILAVTQTSAKIDGADVSVFFTDNMGTKGLLSSFVAAFATVNIYAFCIKRDITIKLPKEVPGAIAQNFRDIFAFSFSILFVAVIDVICRRANVVYGNLTNSKFISSKNVRLSNNASYSRVVPVAKNAVSYAGEVGVNLRSIFNHNPKVPVIYPFARYEYYNPQEKGEAGQTMDLRNKVSMWVAGLNWFALPNLVVKADYTTRQIGTGKMFGTGPYTSENEFSIGLAYIGWFFKK